MNRWNFTISCWAAGVLFLIGCAETPKQTVVRPIPPPPPTPPPGVIISAPMMAQQPNPAVPGPVAGPGSPSANIASTNFVNTSPGNPLGSLEVSTNFQAYAPPQQPLPANVGTAGPGGPGPGPAPALVTQPTPQVEVVPEAPGPDYVWADGYWAWGGTAWVWMPGRWVWHPGPRVMVVPGGGWGYRRHYYGGWRERPYYRYP